MNKINQTIILILIVFFNMENTANANQQTFYDGHEEGWHWYQDPREKSSDETKEDILTSPKRQALEIQKMDDKRRLLKSTLDLAINEPTEENVARYMVLENQVSQQSSVFSKMRKQVLLKYPDLDFTLTHPVNAAAIQVKEESDHATRIQTIRAFAKHAGLFFFYKSTCPYCRKFAPILKDFAERNDIDVIGITLDGISLPEFPNSHTDQGQAQVFHVKVEPSLFIVDPYTQKASPVSYGLVSEVELENSLYRAIQSLAGSKT